MSNNGTGLRVDESAVSVVIEGAVDYALGRPREQNPYTDEMPESQREWDFGWQEAASLFPVSRLDRERDRWRRSRA